jgi:hypothetical protein
MSVTDLAVDKQRWQFSWALNQATNLGEQGGSGQTWSGVVFSGNAATCWQQEERS